MTESSRACDLTKTSRSVLSPLTFGSHATVIRSLRLHATVEIGCSALLRAPIVQQGPIEQGGEKKARSIIVASQGVGEQKRTGSGGSRIRAPDLSRGPHFSVHTYVRMMHVLHQLPGFAASCTPKSHTLGSATVSPALAQQVLRIFPYRKLPHHIESCRFFLSRASRCAALPVSRGNPVPRCLHWRLDPTARVDEKALARISLELIPLEVCRTCRSARTLTVCSCR